MPMSSVNDFYTGVILINEGFMLIRFRSSLCAARSSFQVKNDDDHCVNPGAVCPAAPCVPGLDLEGNTIAPTKRLGQHLGRSTPA